MFRRLMDGLEYFPESLRNFRGQVMGMLEFYFEPIKRRGADAYAAAYAQYFSDMRAAGAMLPDMNDFEQSFPVQVKFVPMKTQPGAARSSWRSRRSSPICPTSSTRIFTVA